MRAPISADVGVSSWARRSAVSADPPKAAQVEVHHDMVTDAAAVGRPAAASSSTAWRWP